MNRPALLDFDEALAQLLSRAHPVFGEETPDTLQALDRVLDQDPRAMLGVPPPDTSPASYTIPRRPPYLTVAAVSLVRACLH